MQVKSCRLRLLVSLPLLFMGTQFVSAQVSIVSGNVYNLVSKTSSLVIDDGGSTTPGTALAQTSAAVGNTNQQWRINSLGGGNYVLICLGSGMALDTGGSTVNGAAVVQNLFSSATASNQQWSINSLGNGYYQLVSASSGMALDNSGSTSAGGSVWQSTAVTGDANQMWQVVPVQIGANTPFISYEAESGTLGGGATAVSLTASPTTEFSSPQLEASGHAYVHLGQTGQSVTWTNNTGKGITAINVRYSIPDAPAGGGITSTLDLLVNGVFRQALNVNSKQTWVYESASNYNGMSKDPTQGVPHVFWDETHAFLAGAAVAPGSTITLQMDSSNSASYYNIDVVDLEAPPAPLAQPANSLSITTDCGATANSASTDSTAAIQSCINTAQSQGKSVWIPQGAFYLNTPGGLTATGITIQGAGMWYSIIYYNPPLPTTTIHGIFQPTSATLKNFAIDGNAIGRTVAGGYSYGINIKGSNWLIDSIWIQHEGPGIWADGTTGTVQNCRINNSWADGINLNNGNGGVGNNSGSNLTAKNNFIRGTGDDGLAINDSSLGLGMTTITLVDNTVVAPWWANNIGVYGGQNDLVANNLATDSVKNYGINIGPFGTQGGPIKSAAVQGNVVNRGGSLGYGSEHSAIGVGVTGPTTSDTNITVNGNTISHALFNGVDVEFAVNATITNNTVDAPSLGGFVIVSKAQGNASFMCNTVTNIASGQQAYVDNAPGFLVSGSCNNGFTTPSTLATPSVTLSLSPTSVTSTQSFTVTAALTGGTGKPVPTGSVILTSGAYTSALTILSAGSATITVTAGALGNGSDTLLATYTPDTASASIYGISYGTASITVGGGFALSNSGPIVVRSGVTTGNSATITVAPSNAFSGTVAMTCAVTTAISNPTAMPTCTISPSVALTGTGPVTATLIVNTTGPTAYAVPARSLFGSAEETAMAMIVFLMIPSARRRRWKAAFALSFLVVCGMGLGCSSGSSGSTSSSGSGGTTAGSYTVTVTGTAGTTTQTTAVSLTVN
jgi:hypothetical protein